LHDTFSSEEVLDELDVILCSSCDNFVNIDSIVIIRVSRKVVPIKKKRKFGKAKTNTNTKNEIRASRKVVPTKKEKEIW
jgi:hypothetical protein